MSTQILQIKRRNGGAPVALPALLVILTLLAAGCVPVPSRAAKEMQWETSGGGQITFSVSRNGQDYDVHVTSYQFEDREVRFAISADSGEVYGALSDVMQDQGGIRMDRSGAPSGSWTTLRFSNGQHSTSYKDVIVEGDLRIIYDYVVEQLDWYTGKLDDAAFEKTWKT